jgi:hypothetical protein
MRAAVRFGVAMQVGGGKSTVSITCVTPLLAGRSVRMTVAFVTPPMSKLHVRPADGGPVPRSVASRPAA